MEKDDLAKELHNLWNEYVDCVDKERESPCADGFFDWLESKVC